MYIGVNYLDNRPTLVYIATECRGKCYREKPRPSVITIPSNLTYMYNYLLVQLFFESTSRNKILKTNTQ